MAVLNTQSLAKQRGDEMPHKSDRRLYLDKDGNVVEADDPRKLTLLVGEGGELPMAEARKHGLVKDDEQPARVETDLPKERPITPRSADAPKKKD